MTNTSVDSSVVLQAVDQLEFAYGLCQPETDQLIADALRKTIVFLKSAIVGGDFKIDPIPKKAGRRKSDPAHDQEIADAHKAGATLDELAEKEGISRQAICKALKRVEERQSVPASTLVSKHEGPYTPTSDDVRTASKLLFGSSDRGTVEEIKEKIKKNL